MKDLNQNQFISDLSVLKLKLEKCNKNIAEYEKLTEGVDVDLLMKKLRKAKKKDVKA